MVIIGNHGSTITIAGAGPEAYLRRNPVCFSSREPRVLLTNSLPPIEAKKYRYSVSMYLCKSAIYDAAPGMSKALASPPSHDMDGKMEFAP
jgi:hypothetical protein